MGPLKAEAAEGFQEAFFPQHQGSARKPAKRLRAEESGATERMRAAACGGTKDAESVTLRGQHRICLVCGNAAALPNALGGQKPCTHFLLRTEEYFMKKDVKFSTRMASKDRETIKELAKRSGMSMSDYVTACCLGKQIIVIDGQKELLRQLKGIGSNINRLTVLANMGKVQIINLDRFSQELSEVSAALRAAVEGR